SISLSEAARDWLADKGYDQLYGARPLSRIIQDKVKKPLADELLFGKLAKGGQVMVDVTGGKLSFEFKALEKKPKRGKKGDGGGKGPAGPETPSGDKIPELVS
ncbi:MAG: ATP-dependent Clp protease ATP-binding subunit ClpA, partial [Alphaproteobacteria bacterium]|nr:ATP-dependent Clp protease ATP-binding subunit ClpA [Alphaproteobacteria bacterium]